IAAWNRYLRLDGKSTWATEAKERLAALEVRRDSKGDDERLRRAVAQRDSQTLTALVAKDPSHARVLTENELGAWAATFNAGDASSAAHLDFARAAATALRVIVGDALMSDAVATIDG